MEIADQKRKSLIAGEFARPIKLLLWPRQPDTLGMEPAFDISSPAKI
jgi:hypothetical protein